MLFLLLWKMDLESVLIKISFHTRKQFCFSRETRVRSRLAYLENASFLSVSHLPRSHRVHDKEHT
jgi:hypothetical protein